MQTRMTPPPDDGAPRQRRKASRPAPIASKGYGEHAGARALGLYQMRPHTRPQACGGQPTADCHVVCQRGCYTPDHLPTPPYFFTGDYDGTTTQG